MDQRWLDIIEKIVSIRCGVVNAHRDIALRGTSFLAQRETEYAIKTIDELIRDIHKQLKISDRSPKV